jgi:hypothetical protein
MMATSKEKLLRTRKRLLEDFAFWAKHSYKIRTKSGEIVPLELNRVQQRFLTSHIIPQLQTVGYVRSIVLKGRQQGLSTVISAFIYWYVSQHKGQKATIIAHQADSTDTLFNMYKRGHENMPEAVKPATKFSNKRELVFRDLDSGLQVDTAGGKGIARGETFQQMHLSEVAFWPSTFAKENFNGLIQALPNAPGTACFVESTANGMSGAFYDLWNGAVKAENGYFPFFSAWFESAEYRETPPPGFTRLPDEIDLAEKYDLDDAQLYWRRRKISATGLDLFKQEYPCTPEEAFITSGRPVFNQEFVHALLSKAHTPIERRAVEQVADAKGTVDWRCIEHPRGELLVYRKLDPNETYYIGADVAVGIKDPQKSDWCVAQVLDSQKRQAAVWRGQVSPDYFARVLSTIGYYYNIAMVAPERNGHGLLVCVRLHKDYYYPNVFTDVREGELADRESLNIGFQTNVSSKPLIIDKLRGEVNSREIAIYDQTTLQEMLSFVVTESGKMQAEDGCFDDAVMALAIANHIHEGKFTPIVVTDDYYVTAI